MNPLRDPFSVRNNPRFSPALQILRQPFQQVHTISSEVHKSTQSVLPAVNSAKEAAKKTLEQMSFTLPKNVPSFTSSQRELENKAWNLAFGRGKELPLYKDKPYYSGSVTGKRKSRQGKIFALAMAGALLFAIYWFGLFNGDGLNLRVHVMKDASPDWNARREAVKEVFVESWTAYERDAWGSDIYNPVSQKGSQMSPRGLGWMIVDSLDTMMIMNLTSQLANARQWVHTLNYDQEYDVNVFETTIRMVGGLLSAYYLQEVLQLVPSDSKDKDMYLEKATDLADRLIGAFESPSGVPYTAVNLHDRKPNPPSDVEFSSTAEVASLQLEMKYLAKLTGEAMYWEKAEKVMTVIEKNAAPDGLVPIFIDPISGKFQGEQIRFGSRGDSYYEYLLKQYLQTNKTETVYEDMYIEAMSGMKKHLVAKSHPNHLTFIAELPNGIGNVLLPKMDHLVCFVPGMLALGATGGKPVEQARKEGGGTLWGTRQEDDLHLAREIMHTCYQSYAVMNTGLAPEISWFDIDHVPGARSKHPDYTKDILINPNDTHNLQRPETVESLFIMYRLTKDEIYREWGWEIFESFREHTKVETGGYSSLDDVTKVPAPLRDNMESFWMSETLKYLYLLFSPDDLLPLEKVVFNTEAHPFPIIDTPSHFNLSWSQKPRKPSSDSTQKVDPNPNSENPKQIKITL